MTKEELEEHKKDVQKIDNLLEGHETSSSSSIRLMNKEETLDQKKANKLEHLGKAGENQNPKEREEEPKPQSPQRLRQPPNPRTLSHLNHKPLRQPTA